MPNDAPFPKGKILSDPFEAHLTLFLHQFRVLQSPVVGEWTDVENRAPFPGKFSRGAVFGIYQRYAIRKSIC